MAKRDRILVIGYDARLVLMMGDLLSIEGYKAEMAFDAQSGIEMTKRHRFDLILVDSADDKPAEDSLLKRLLSDPRIASTPMILISASSDCFNQALPGAVSAYLHKPFRMDELTTRVRNILRPSPHSATLPLGI